MCNPILIGVAIGASVAAIQGGGPKEILIGAAIGGVSGGVAAPAHGLTLIKIDYPDTFDFPIVR